jgi:hypothetical protein
VLAEIDIAGCNRGKPDFLGAQLAVCFSDCWGLGVLMDRSMSDAVEEKSSRRAAEENFHAKLGPWPAFRPSAAETGQGKPTK